MGRRSGTILAVIIFMASMALAADPAPQSAPVPDWLKRTQVSCNAIKGPRTMVALVFGQSNSANHGQAVYTSRQDVYSFYAGKCFKAMDPLPGATGDGGSVWTHLGDMLIQQGLYEKALFVPIGVGGTPISRWTAGGDLNSRIADAVSSLQAAGFKITTMLWHQGEADAAMGTKKDDYKRMFMDMLAGIRKLGVDAPIFVAVATRCGGPIGYEIQQAQRELVNPELKISPGAYTDDITDMDDRRDACHFSASGMEKHAWKWLMAIKYSGI